MGADEECLDITERLAWDTRYVVGHVRVTHSNAIDEIKSLRSQLSQALRELGEAREILQLKVPAALTDRIRQLVECESARDAALRSTAELRGALEAVREWFSGNTVRSEKAMRPLIERIDTALASSSTKETPEAKNFNPPTDEQKP